jgi:hypothetical protein
MDRLEELYEDFIDRIINDYPLTSNQTSDYDDAININQQIINRISNIRRYLTDAEHAGNIEQGEYSENIEYIGQGIEYNDSEIYNNINNQYINDNIEYITDDSTALNVDVYEDTLTEMHYGNNTEFDLTDTNNYIIDRLFNYVVNTTFSDFTYTDLNELNDVKITLTKEQFDKFEKRDVSESDKLTNCSICMDNYKLDEKMVILKCNHTYHENCIENWLCNQKVTCPICRKDTREMLDERD